MSSKYKKPTQSWKNNKKKYYVSRSKHYSPKKTLKRKIKRGDSFISNFFQNYKKQIFLILGSFFLLCFLIAFAFLIWISRSLPNPNQLMNREIAQSTKIYDRSGETVLYEIHGNEQRTLVNLEEIPENLKNATIAIEDKNFYHHKGISLLAILRTAITNILYNKRAGASTLTQQFVKNSILSNEKKYTRKIKEALLAYKIEKRFSKEEILQMYFNEIPYGSTAYGVEAASQKYFAKHISDINLAEAAILAALPQGPSRYSPYGPNYDLLIGRQHYILDLMLEQKYASQEDIDIAKAYELEFKKQSSNIKAPHFVMYIKEQLSEKYGEKLVEQGGLKIITTLDTYKQEIAEEIITEKAEKNLENYQAENAALVSIDPKTGQILAMVGSKDYFSEKIDGQVNIATSKRQPGSSLKPLIYAATFIKGYTPNTILYDVVTNFSNNKDEPYEPHNYDDKEHGPVTIRKALAGSLNIPAVKAIYLAGVQNVLDIADALAYTTLKDRNRFGLSLVLGGGEVKLLEHVNAYSAFAREGIVHPSTGILKVEDKDGNILEEYKEKDGKKVLDAKISQMINDILSDNPSRAYAFGESNWLTLGSRPVAAKTGTTNDYRDAWTIGYTPSLVTGVWVGNNDNSEMKRGAAGGTVAAPIWHDYMKKILGDTPIEEFKKANIQKTGKAILDGEVGAEMIIKIDKVSGLLATDLTPPSMIEERIYTEPHNILYYVLKDKPLGDIPKNPEKDPQFNLWEDAVLKWAEKQKATSTLVLMDEIPPTEYDDVHTQENIPELEILSPSNNQPIIKPILFSRIKTSAKRNINRIEYYIDNNLFFINSSYPYNLAKQINFLKNGFHNLKVRACDDVDNCKEKELEFNLILENENIGAKTSVFLEEPSSGLALNNIDFPLNIKFKIENPEQAAKLKIYQQSEEGEKKLINIIEPIDFDLIIFAWGETPPSGTYKLFGELTSWQGDILNSNEPVLIINNINTVDKESADEE
jgi:1A family penicillin-binding protein